MKKILTAFMLVFSILMFSQEYKRFYQKAGLKKNTDKEYRFSEFRSVIFFNYQNKNQIYIVTRDNEILLEVVSKPKLGYSKIAGYYQSMVIRSAKGYGDLYLYDDPSMGVLILFKDLGLAFIDEVEY